MSESKIVERVVKNIDELDVVQKYGVKGRSGRKPEGNVKDSGKKQVVSKPTDYEFSANKANKKSSEAVRSNNYYSHLSAMQDHSQAAKFASKYKKEKVEYHEKMSGLHAAAAELIHSFGKK